MADTTVKYFHSQMVGAPTLNGVAGSIIAILDACLVNGFGLGTLDSLIITGGVAVATRAAGHSQEVGSVALIAGATVTGGTVNGEQKVTAATATTFSFAVPGISNQTATGTITAKLAPATWAKTFTGTNKAAYKSTDVAATGCMLRVDDAATLTARVVGYEVMTDVDTGTGPFPTGTQQSGGSHWAKSSTANATANFWMLVADSRFIYFARAYRSGNNSAPNDYQLHVFGDIVPTKSGDPFGCIISGEATDQSGSNVTSAANYWYGSSGTATGLFTARSYTGLGSSIITGKAYPTLNSQSTPGCSGSNVSGTPFPNPTDGGLYVVPHYIFESLISTNNIHRGVSPGYYCSPQNIPVGQFAARDTVTGVTGLTGKTLKALTCQAGTPNGVVFFDITGPWR